MAAIQLRQDRTQILNYLWDLQNDKGYISDSDVRRLSRELDFSVVEVEGILSFYHFFHREPTGKYIIYLNNSIVSEVKGFEKIKEAFEKETEGNLEALIPRALSGYLKPPVSDSATRNLQHSSILSHLSILLPQKSKRSSLPFEMVKTSKRSETR